MQHSSFGRELAETLQHPYAATYRMVKKLSKNLHMKASKLRLEGVAEIDGVYVKAGLKGKRSLRRRPRKRWLERRGRGTYAVDKLPVLGVVERDGPVRLIVDGCDGEDGARAASSRASTLRMWRPSSLVRVRMGVTPPPSIGISHLERRIPPP